MADDLLNRRLVDAKLRREVIELLGEPTPTAYFRNWDLVYCLGPERGIGVDYEWLVVRFDQADRVSDCQIVRD